MFQKNSTTNSFSAILQMMKAHLLRQNTKRVIAGLLAVWLSGVVFLFCCETSQAKTSETESCPLAKKNHCNKNSADANALELVSLQTENQTFDCCRFPFQVFDKARKIEPIQQAATISAVLKIPTPRFSFVKTDFKFPTVYQSFVHNRSSTFLRNCVFRI
jgi:hypothetical protein